MARRKGPDGNEYVTQKLPGGKRRQIMIGEDTTIPGSTRKYFYSPERAAPIIDLYMRLTTMKEVAAEARKLPGYAEIEPAVIYRWMQDKADFALKMREAKKLRALYFENRALEEADSADEDNVQSQRLKVDTLKWAAGVNDPETYGSRTKVVGDPNQPISFLIDTGIARPPENLSPPTGAPLIELSATTSPGESK